MSVPYMMNNVKVAYAPLTQLRSGIAGIAGLILLVVFYRSLKGVDKRL